MKGFDVLHIKSAVKSRNRIPLYNSHLTTGDFGQILPLKFIETIPGGQYDISSSYFCRTAPLVKPTYGKFSFKTVSAFVPYHQIAFDAEAFISGKTTFEGSATHHRFFTFDTLRSFVTSYCCTTTGATSTNSQYTIIDSVGNTVYYIFTHKGRYWVKVLNSLGYALPQGVDLQTGSAYLSHVAWRHLSAYPFLAYFKLYNDYMSQSQRFNSSQLSFFLQHIKYNKSFSDYNDSTGELSSTLLKAMFDNLHLNYENDYFTSAWQKSNAPIGSSSDLPVISVPEVSGTSIHNDPDGTYSVGFGQHITQRMLDFMRSFDDFVRRNNYSGSRVVQQIYSRFGIKTGDYRSHYAEVLSTDTMPIQVGDVTATADSSNVPLGDYAGKAIADGSKNFSIKVSDYGMILVLGYFTVTPMMSFGFDRTVLRTAPLDYYTPEFDGMGADAISVGEVFASPIGTGTTLDTDVFGFTERYNSYRFARDFITGDFRDYRATGDMNTWHSGRNLEALRSAGTLVAQSSSMNTMPGYDSEFNRIFSVSSGDVDHFYLTCQFKVDAVLPIMNANQSVRLGEGDTNVPRNGNVIS